MKNTAVISSATILTPQTVFGSKANSAIRIGVIGLGNRGSQLTEYFLENPEVEITYLCDVNRSEFARGNGNGPKEEGENTEKSSRFS